MRKVKIRLLVSGLNVFCFGGGRRESDFCFIGKLQIVVDQDFIA